MGTSNLFPHNSNYKLLINPEYELNAQKTLRKEMAPMFSLNRTPTVFSFILQKLNYINVVTRQ